MKKIMQILMIATFLVTSSTSYALSGEGTRCVQSEEAVKRTPYGHIDARGLKALMDANTSFFLLDARGNKWNDGTMIPGARLASYEFSPEELEQIIPNQNDLIIVYCYTFTCPLSRYLTDKLVELGYNNVLEYPGGLKEWREVAEYPVVPIEE
ncbi:MAG: rhodanese-like domain-containing protein [Parachlamydiales bacterium]|jgi:rhodanese-related sulfurtransferase